MSSGGVSAGGIFGAASDLFGGVMGFISGNDAAKAYNEAATYAKQNAMVAGRSGEIQEAQAARDLYQTLSGASAVEAGGGVGSGGSGQYIQRASLQQGGLQKAIIVNNAFLQVQGYMAEASADKGQATAASDQATGALGGGILGAIGSIFSL